MRSAIDDDSLGAGNVPYWLRERGDSLCTPRLWLDRPWTAPDGTSRAALSLADIIDAAEAYRQMYETLGVRIGDVVASRIGTPIDVYLQWIALASNGAIYAPVNPNFSDDALENYGRRIGAVGVIVEADSRGVGAASRATGLQWRSHSSDTLSSRSVAARPAVGSGRAAHPHRPDDIVLLCHTSGTTGPPKAVSCSNRGFLAGILSQMSQPRSSLVGSSMLNALPVAHHAWFMSITWSLLSGTKLILASDQSARTVVDDALHFEPDSIRSFSCTLRDVARLGLSRGALRSVGLWMTTGDVSRRSDIAVVSALGTHPVAGPEGISRAPGMFVLDGFGSTELGHLHFSALYAPGRSHEARCIGRPASFASAAILDEDGRELPDGEIGYLAVRSDAVTPGYWNDPERTAKSRRNGFWITGDVGYRDASGRYFHLDRNTDVVETPAGLVYSVRCEEELQRSIPEIERCAIVGRRNADGIGRVLCLIESADPHRDAQSWHHDVNAVLTSASLTPVAETIVMPPGALPLGPTGKIRKYLARARLESAAAQ